MIPPSNQQTLGSLATVCIPQLAPRSLEAIDGPYDLWEEAAKESLELVLDAENQPMILLDRCVGASDGRRPGPHLFYTCDSSGSRARQLSLCLHAGLPLLRVSEHEMMEFSCHEEAVSVRPFSVFDNSKLPTVTCECAFPEEPL